jgi:hypothetical protein
VTAKTVIVATVLGGKLPSFLDAISGASDNDGLLRWRLQANQAQTDTTVDTVTPSEVHEQLTVPLVRDTPPTQPAA